MNTLLPQSKRVENQVRKYSLVKKTICHTISLKVKARFDDSCNNGHNTFALTGDYTYHHNSNNHKDEVCGAIHDEIAQYFPELAHLTKWHGCTTDGPLYYIENTSYHIEQGNLRLARQTAIWPHATAEQLLDVNAMMERLPALMQRFRQDMEYLGFEY